VVHVADGGSVFDASVAEVWAYLGSRFDHQKAHGHTAVVRRLGKGTGLYSWIQPFEGRPTRFTMRWRSYHPLGIAYRVERGPFAGSAFFLYYTPTGRRTAVTVVGEFVSPTLPSARVAAAVRRFFAKEFVQDRVGLRQHRARARGSDGRRRRSVGVGGPSNRGDG
jgi:hypothetical protein